MVQAQCFEGSIVSSKHVTFSISIGSVDQYMQTVI